MNTPPFPPPSPGPMPPPAESSAVDPTPILSAIGQIHSPIWGDEYSRIVLLERSQVALQMLMLAVGVFTALMPWVLGVPGIAPSFVMFDIVFIVMILAGRYNGVRGVTPQVTFAGKNRTQAVVRTVLFVTILLIWIIGMFWAGMRAANNTPPSGLTAPAMFVIFGGYAVVALVSIFARVRNRHQVGPPGTPHHG